MDGHILSQISDQSGLRIRIVTLNGKLRILILGFRDAVVAKEV